MTTKMRRVLTVATVAIVMACLYGDAQPIGAQGGGLVVTPSGGTITPADIAQTLVGPGVAISNVTYTGDPLALGTFSGGTGILGGTFESGIVLSSGDVTKVVGPNQSDSTTTNFCIPTGGVFPLDCVPNGDPDLDQIVAPGTITGTTTFDAAVLEFDFVPPGNVVKFRYVFTSEEYNEWANSPFNNVFAFYLNGANYALLPDGITPASINNVNGGDPFTCTNGIDDDADGLIDNGDPDCTAANDNVVGEDKRNSAFFINNDCSDPDGGLACPINIEADGLTVVLTFTAPVIPGPNHMKLAIADTGDHILDSWAFLEPATFTQVLEVCGDFVDNNLNGFVDEGCSQEQTQIINVDDGEHTFVFTGLGSTFPITLRLNETTTLRTHNLKVIVTILDPRELLLPLSNPAVFPFGTTCLPTNTSDGSERPCVLISVVDADTGNPPIPGVDYDVEPGAILWFVDTAVTKPVNGNVGLGHFRSDMVQFPVDFVDENIILTFDGINGESDNYTGVTPTVTPPTAPPLLVLPDPIVAEATGPGGASVSYTATGSGMVKPDLSTEGPVFKEIPIGQPAQPGHTAYFDCQPSSGSLFPLGDTTVNCSVTDDNTPPNTTTGSFMVTVEDTTPPVVTVPGDVVANATGPGGAMVSYPAATAHDNMDGDLTPTCDPPSGSTFLPGVTVVNCSATDAQGNVGTNSFTVTVIADTTPPALSVTLSRTTLWPPNHKLVQITATINVSDTADPNPTVTLVSITSNEPDNGLGDGDTVNDIQGADVGTDDRTFFLRAERSGKGTGRIYTITYEAVDASGNTRKVIVYVRVPHNQGK